MPISEAAEQVSHRIGVPGTRAAPLAYFQSNGVRGFRQAARFGWLAGEEPATLRLERGKEPASIMPVAWSDIVSAFEFVSGGDGGETVFLCRETGEMHWHSGNGDNFEELPEDIDDREKYVKLPDKRDLDLGQRLVMRFTREELPTATTRSSKSSRVAAPIGGSRTCWSTKARSTSGSNSKMPRRRRRYANGVRRTGSWSRVDRRLRRRTTPRLRPRWVASRLAS